MPSPNEPPPGRTALAAAAGGFIGGVVGVVAAGMLTGDGSNGSADDNDAMLKPEPAAEVYVAKK